MKKIHWKGMKYVEEEQDAAAEFFWHQEVFKLLQLFADPSSGLQTRNTMSWGLGKGLEPATKS